MSGKVLLLLVNLLGGGPITTIEMLNMDACQRAVIHFNEQIPKDIGAECLDPVTGGHGDWSLDNLGRLEKTKHGE
jgi:hypothetical protein